MQQFVHTLSNGLRTVLTPMPGAKTASIFVMAGTGSRYESASENGLAHFLEHMFFKGTEMRPNAQAISRELDSVGAVYNAFTAKDRTGYYAKAAKERVPTILEVITDIFLNSKLPPGEIEKERGAVLQEIDMYEDMPMRTVDMVFDALIFGNDHPLGRTILGPKENIRNFGRRDFAAYQKRNYVPLNTIVSVAGAFDSSDVLKHIRSNFESLRHGNPPDYISFSSQQDSPRISIRLKKTDQTHLMLGVPAYPFLHADEYALEVLATILGGSMSSRLFEEVREKRGLAYSINAWVERYSDTGYFAVQAGVEHAKLDEALETISAELRKVKRVPIETAELQKAKDYIKGTRAIALETSDAIAADAAVSLISIGRIRALPEIEKGVDAVTADDISRVAGDIFRAEKMNLAIIGPHPKKDHLYPLLLI